MNSNLLIDAQHVGRGVWLRSLTVAIDAKELDHLGITHVLSICERLNSRHRPLDYKWVTIQDDPSANLLKHLSMLTRWITKCSQSGKKVLVHCHDGKSRSAAVVSAWLMTLGAFDRDVVYFLLKKLRPEVQINHGFMTQLQTWQAQQSRIRQRRQRTQFVKCLAKCFMQFDRTREAGGVAWLVSRFCGV